MWKCAITFLFLGLTEKYNTFYLNQRLLGKILEELVEKLTACCQNSFMGSELVSCNKKKKKKCRSKWYSSDISLSGTQYEMQQLTWRCWVHSDGGPILFSPIPLHLDGYGVVSPGTAFPSFSFIICQPLSLNCVLPTDCAETRFFTCRTAATQQPPKHLLFYIHFNVTALSFSGIFVFCWAGCINGQIDTLYFQHFPDPEDKHPNTIFFDAKINTQHNIYLDVLAIWRIKIGRKQQEAVHFDIHLHLRMMNLPSQSYLLKYHMRSNGHCTNKVGGLSLHSVLSDWIGYLCDKRSRLSKWPIMFLPSTIRVMSVNWSNCLCSLSFSIMTL